MTTLRYRVLFEVRILHDYYLFGPEPANPDAPAAASKSYFDMSDLGQKARLKELLRRGRYDIQSDLDFIIGSVDRKALQDLRLRMVKTPTGFFIGVEVETITPNGRPARFAPVIKPPDGMTLTIGLVFRNRLFGAISNLRVDRDSTDIYLFSNDGDGSGMSLSNPVGLLEAGRRYQMGDLALVDGDLRQASVGNDGNPAAWTPISGGGFVHQGDRRLSVDTDWTQEWLLTLGHLPSPPRGVIRISLKNGRRDRSPLGEDALLPDAPPVFELRFLSRKTYWRYRKGGGFSSEEMQCIEREGQAILDRKGDVFVTKEPRALARELPPLVPSSSALSRIPNARPGSLKAEDVKVYSEVYFNRGVIKPR